MDNQKIEIKITNNKTKEKLICKNKKMIKVSIFYLFNRSIHIFRLGG